MTTSPWSPFGMLRLGVGNVVCLGMLGAGWAMVDRGDDLGSQVAWLNLSIAGLLVGLWVNIRWLIDGRRAVGLGIRRLDGMRVPESVEIRVAGGADGVQRTGELVAGAGLLRYHRRSCLLARGKAWDVASAETHRSDGRTPCGVCRP